MFYKVTICAEGAPTPPILGGVAIGIGLLLHSHKVPRGIKKFLKNLK